VTNYTLELTDGWHNITIKVVDKAGNAYKDSICALVDTTPPVINIIFPSNGSTVLNEITIKWIASDNIGIDHFTIYVDGSLENVSLPPNVLNYSLVLSEGWHNITVIAVDIVGNTAYDYVIIYVRTSIPFYVIAPIVCIITIIILFLFFRRKKMKIR